MRTSCCAAGIAAMMLVSSTGALTACWPLDPLADCEQNPYLACFDWGPSVPGGDGGTDGGVDPKCVPSADNTLINDSCGVFVSSGGDDGNDGSQTKPLKTLAAAVQLAKEKGKPVYACAEEHAGSVTLTSGITLYGGLDCGKGWTYVGMTKKSVLVGNADEVALTISKSAGGVEVVDFTIRALDATKEGGSSIALLVDGVAAELVRCELVAGNGATGTDGAHGNPNGMTAASGAAGNNGVDACSDLDGMPGPDTSLDGGDQVTNDCGSGGLSVGGQGGDGNVSNGGGGDDGQVGAAGLGGKGEPGVGMWSCIAGSGLGDGGSPGEAGMPGAGATGLGLLSASGYAGTSGGTGTSGKAGQGGGGGGGAKGGMICSGNPGSGASGGSGGAGGCGGLPGQGGRPGGASIALVSLNASLTLTDCTLSSSKGGDGGVGGGFQPGGPGGLAGLGGAGVGGSNPGCSGGQGGKGGNGGPGGGGLGGPSLGIAFKGDPPERTGATAVVPGTPGAGGLGGNANAAMNPGEAGVAAEELKFP